MNEISLKVTLAGEGKQVIETYNNVYAFKVDNRRVSVSQFVGEYGQAKISMPMKNVSKIVIDVNNQEDTRG